MSLRTIERLVPAVVFTVAASLGCSSVWAQSPHKTVLTVHWGTEDYPTNPVEDAGIREALLLGSDAVIDYYAEYLESERFPEEEASLALRDYIRRKYQGRRIDAVIAVTDVALQFVLRFRSELFPDAPVVYRGVAAADASVRNAGAGLTGLQLGGGLNETLDLALQLHPSTERAFIVAQAPNTGLQDVMRRAFVAVEGRVTITYINEEPLPRLIAAIKAVPPRSVILYVRYSQEDPGNVLFPAQIARLVAEASPVPVYGISDSYIGSGVVGGAMYQTRAVGTRLGELTRQVLDGTRPQDIPIERGTLVPTFDWRQLRRWGISETLLPAGSVTMYKQPGVWELYKPQIIGASMLLVVQSGLIVALLVQRTRQRRTREALLESQRRYTLATGAGALGVWDWNFETNELYVDPVLKSLLGFEDAEITNRPEDWGSRVHPQDVPAAAARVKACIDGETDVYDIEHRMLHKDGSAKWFLSRGSAIRGLDGTVRRLVGTKVDITERKRGEEAIRESEAALQASYREIRYLAGSLITAQDAERARVARDLHDDVSQQLAALSIALSGIRRRVEAVPYDEDLRIGVSSLQQRAVELVESVRQISYDLHPDVLKHGGLTDVLAAHCAGISRAQSIGVTCTAEGDFDSIEPEVAYCLYRVAQEALHNVVKHAHARHAEVRLLRTSDSAELTITDDGKGFDIVEARKNGKGLGLVSINERVRLAGGTLSVVTEWQKGTRVHVRLPTGSLRAPHDAGDASERYAAT